MGNYCSASLIFAEKTGKKEIRRNMEALEKRKH
jgi:hypothetical protein